MSNGPAATVPSVEAIVNVSEDTFVGGSSEAGVGYTTSSSY